ncbi:MAG: M1 family metallopeptidase [Chitinophagaceae bacterium]
MICSKKIKLLSTIVLTFATSILQAQHNLSEKYYVDLSHADTLRGNIHAPERTWWDILRYDVTVKPDYNKKYISGTNKITYKVVKDSYPAFMQIDLQEPMLLDSVVFDGNRKLTFTREGNAFHVNVPKQKEGSEGCVVAYFHGNPRVAKKAPWDGGWIFTKDSLGRPWMTVACQGLGASVWYPCKDVQDDEPDNGASLTMIVPDSLVAVGNGRKVEEKRYDNGWKSVKWQVANPINNYTLIPYIGKYVDIADTYKGLKGNLDVHLWALDYNRDKMVQHCQPEVLRMLKAFEHWFGPYPFYEDGYKLVDAPHLGMEHQSAVAYGNHYLNGYAGKDLSGTGIGLKWDFIVVHESGHEWFANSITSKDIADMWIHESFTNYSETLFTEYWYGRQDGQEYCYGIRNNILNDKPIIGPYGVNREGSGDMYYKGANMINSIRNAIGDDEKFRNLLVNMNKTFYHKTVTAEDIQNFISQESGIDLSKVFDQYLRTVQVPELEYAFSEDKKKLYFRYVNCVPGFNLPLYIRADKGATTVKLNPTEQWQDISINSAQARLITPVNIEFQYYLTTKKVDAPEGK